MLNYYCGNIDIFDDATFFENCLDKVDENRRKKILRCKNEADKRRSLLAGLLLRYALEDAGYVYGELIFELTSEGKPFIKTDEPLHFSISHSGDYVGCVLSDETVGLDMEDCKKRIFKPEKRTSLEAMAKKCFSGEEWEGFCNSLEPEKYFIECWTKKEAYSKYIGKGLGMDFSGINTESREMEFWTAWTEVGYHVTIYRKSQVYKELRIKKLGLVDLKMVGEKNV